MKKLLALLLALSCAATMTACGTKEDDKENDKEKEKVEEKIEEKADASEDVRKTLENCLNSICDLDIASAEQYVAELPEELKSLDLATIMDEYKQTAFADMPDEIAPYSTQIEKMYDDAINAVINKVTLSMTYNIKEIVADGDKYVAKIEVTHPDFNSDIEGMLSAAFNEDTIMTAAASIQNNITESTTEAEMFSMLFDEVSKVVVNEINNLTLPTVTSEFEWDVKSVDGNWVIVVE